MRDAMPKRQKVEVDLEKHSASTVHTDGSHGVLLPNDIPIHLTCFRLMEEVEKQQGRKPLMGLAGWTVVLDAMTFGVKLYVRVGRDGTLKVFAEDETGREKLVEWNK